nr:MAG TPA: hypothetical protein [Myoviridae sp. ct5lt7]
MKKTLCKLYLGGKTLFGIYTELYFQNIPLNVKEGDDSHVDIILTFDTDFKKVLIDAISELLSSIDDKFKDSRDEYIKEVNEKMKNILHISEDFNVEFNEKEVDVYFHVFNTIYIASINKEKCRTILELEVM